VREVTFVRRRWIVAATAALLLTTAAACGADGSDDASDTTTTSSQSSTTSESGTTTTGGGGSDISEEQLSGALLTVDDLPSGFAVSSNEDDDSDTDDETDDLKAGDPGCQEALDALDAATNDEDDEVTALATFERNDVEEVEHELKAVPDAAERLQSVRSTLEDDCGNRVEFTTDDASSGLLEVVDGAQHGDGTFYAKMTFAVTEQDAEAEVSAIVVYQANEGVGSTITLLSVDVPSMDLDGDEPTMADAEAVAAKAQERYEDVFG